MIKKIIITAGIFIIGGGFIILRHIKAEDDFMYAGTLETTKVVLSSKVGTDILEIPVLEGDSVKKGDLIVKLNDDSYKVVAKQLNNDYIRYQRLLEKGNTTPESFDKVEREKKENDLRITWCKIKSPINGVVVTKFKEIGEYVTVGSNIVSIADLSDVWAYFYVPYDMVYKLKIGDKVKGVLQELPNNVFEGTIVKINEEAEFTPKNVQTREERTRLVYGVKVRFNNKDLLLKSGMTVETSFNGR